MDIDHIGAQVRGELDKVVELLLDQIIIRDKQIVEKDKLIKYLEERFGDR